jgi:hypothetical protein
MHASVHQLSSHRQTADYSLLPKYKRCVCARAHASVQDYQNGDADPAASAAPANAGGATQAYKVNLDNDGKKVLPPDRLCNVTHTCVRTALCAYVIQQTHECEHANRRMPNFWRSGLFSGRGRVHIKHQRPRAL